MLPLQQWSFMVCVFHHYQKSDMTIVLSVCIRVKKLGDLEARGQGVWGHRLKQ